MHDGPFFRAFFPLEEDAAVDRGAGALPSPSLISISLGGAGLVVNPGVKAGVLNKGPAVGWVARVSSSLISILLWGAGLVITGQECSRTCGGENL